LSVPMKFYKFISDVAPMNLRGSSSLVPHHRQTYGGRARQLISGHVASKFVGVPMNLDAMGPLVNLYRGGRVTSTLMNLLARETRAGDSG
jgi:hypothetical protein